MCKSSQSQPSRTLCQRVCLLSAIGLAVLLIPLRLASQTPNKPDSVEVITYFRTALPPDPGAPVCLTGGEKPIGNINSVRLLPQHDEYHNAWEVIMEINRRDASTIMTDSVAQANPLGNCGVFINVIGALPIAYHTVLKGEVNYVADIAYMLPPKPWWKPAADFLAIDFGIIWIEIIGALILMLVVATMLIKHARRIR
jgi:hypothetical protein